MGCLRSWLLILFSFLTFFSRAQHTSLVFHALSIKDGLSEGTVRAIGEDFRGFRWFGTEDGLNKYDGYTFSVYKNAPGDPHSIGSNNIKCIFNDSQGNLWIGTRHGLSLYDPNLDRFYNSGSEEILALRNIVGDVETVLEDKHHHLWVITSAEGIYRIKNIHQAAERFQFSGKGAYSIFASMSYVANSHQLLIGTGDGLLQFNIEQQSFVDLRPNYGQGYQIRDLLPDTDHVLWIATTKGFGRIKLDKKEIKFWKSDASPSMVDNTIRLLKLKEGILVGNDGQGLILFSPETESRKFFTRESGAQLSSNNITSMFLDKKGTLWIGTFLNGVNFTNNNTNFFVMVRNNSPSSNSLRTGVVTGFLNDSKGSFWISTDGGGVYCKRKGKTTFENYTKLQANPLLHSDAVTGMMEDSEHTIWMSTYAGGLTSLKSNGTKKIFHHDPSDPGSLVWDKIKGLAEYQQEIWTTSYGMGISVYNKQTGKFRTYTHKKEDSGSIPSNWAYWFFKDSRNTLWIATFEGLCEYLPETKNFRTYRFNTTSSSADKNYIFDIFEDSQKRLWLGTNGGGLALFDRDSKKFKLFTTNDGLSDNAVRSILEDDYQQLWLATNNGVTKFNLKTMKSVSYTLKDGLPPCSFFFNAKYKDNSGSIYFGTNEGYLIINPDYASDAPEFPSVVLTKLSSFNRNLVPGDSSFLSKHISVATQITLPYSQNSLSFEFAGLSFSIPKHNFYSYQLDGFDKGWIQSGKSRLATYTNLNPGTYVFRVKASTNEKIWGEAEKEFMVIITPPFWQTWWFRILMAVIAIGSILLIIRIRTRFIQQRNRLLSRQVAERTYELQEVNEQLKEHNEEVKSKSEQILAQQKDLLDKKYTLEKNFEKLSEWNDFQQKLIGIIGHDIRGPLHRFSGLLQVVDESSFAFVLDKLKENAATLSLLATELLTWVSLQTSKNEIETNEISLDNIWFSAAKEVENFRAEKNVSFVVQHGPYNQAFGITPIVLASVRNIVSNALRYSPPNGIVEIETGILYKGCASIRITDYGKGFDAAEINRLIGGEGFNGMKSTYLQDGAGLGLTLCNDMMKRFEGCIEAASIVGSGATFYICLKTSQQESGAEVKAKTEPEPDQLERLSSLKNKQLLLVDDDDSIRWPLFKVLTEYLQVLEMRSAEESLIWLHKNTPDMAILDVHMSGISGIELCRKIKQSPETAHLPCLVISGESNEQIRQQAFEAGADGFLAKPFSPMELLVQVVSHFENQERLLKRYFEGNIPLESINSNELNKDFLHKLNQIIEQNLSNTELSVDFIARELGTSKSGLYRKLKSLTGLSANIFIKNFRMRKSIELLKVGKLNISEIAHETGFSTASYFTTAFKKHYGYNPSEFKG